MCAGRKLVIQGRNGKMCHFLINEVSISQSFFEFCQWEVWWKSTSQPIGLPLLLRGPNFRFSFREKKNSLLVIRQLNQGRLQMPWSYFTLKDIVWTNHINNDQRLALVDKCIIRVSWLAHILLSRKSWQWACSLWMFNSHSCCCCCVCTLGEV